MQHWYVSTHESRTVALIMFSLVHTCMAYVYDQSLNIAFVSAGGTL